MFNKVPDVEYVPVFVNDIRSYAERWGDKLYLDSVVKMADSTSFKSECIRLMEMLRGIAAKAETPEELKGVNRCIRQVEQLMVIGETAKRSLQLIEAGDV